MDSILDIEFWVQDLAGSKVKRFYPSTFTKTSSLSLEIVFNKLIEMSMEGKLNLLWEIECPECYSTCETITSEDMRLLTLNESAWQCRYGHDFIVTADTVFPAFEINSNYKRKVSEYNRNKESKKKTFSNQAHIIKGMPSSAFEY